MNTYGYIRVSSTEQNEGRQLDALRNKDIPMCRIFMDKQSGKDFQRPQYQRLVRIMEAGDTLCILSIDRLGRNYEEIQNQWRILTKEIGVEICVIDMPLLDTSKGKDLMGTFIADLTLQILSFVAQTERENILVRQAEGIAAAKARGVRFGRKRMEMPGGFYKLADQWNEGLISARKAAAQLGISHHTFLKCAREYIST